MRNHKGQIPGRINTDFQQKPPGFMKLKPQPIFYRLDAIIKYMKKVVSGINPGRIWTFWQSLGDFDIPGHLRTMDLIDESIKKVVSGFPGRFVPDFSAEP